MAASQCRRRPPAGEPKSTTTPFLSRTLRLPSRLCKSTAIRHRRPEMSSSTSKEEQLKLFTYFRSSCSARLRIALAFKKIHHETTYVNIKDGEHMSEEYAQVNPSRSVPTLRVPGSPPRFLTQSVAALEYLEEAYPMAPPLLPPPEDYLSRATVRVLVNIIANDLQPVTNMKVLKATGELGGDAVAWMTPYYEQAFSSYEEILKESAGKHSHGNTLSLADVCLAPACWNAERYGISLDPYPTLAKVCNAMSEHPAVQAAHWTNQEDCPHELRS